MLSAFWFELLLGRFWCLAIAGIFCTTAISMATSIRLFGNYCFPPADRCLTKLLAFSFIFRFSVWEREPLQWRVQFALKGVYNTIIMRIQYKNHIIAFRLPWTYAKSNRSQVLSFDDNKYLTINDKAIERAMGRKEPKWWLNEHMYN